MTFGDCRETENYGQLEPRATCLDLHWLIETQEILSLMPPCERRVNSASQSGALVQALLKVIKLFSNSTLNNYIIYYYAVIECSLHFSWVVIRYISFVL